jgi:putative phage-type endonuclease
VSLTPEQKALRKTGIGASEAAGVLGLDPYKKPIDVWAAKVEGAESPDSLPIRVGHALEPVAANLYAEQTGAKLRTSDTLRHPRCQVLLATPDRIATLPDGDRVLEVKTASLRRLKEWGEPGTDGIPLNYLVQVQLQLAVTGLPVADVAALIGNEDLRIYTVPGDSELQGQLMGRLEKWWRDFVVTGTPPPPDGSDSYSDWLKTKYAAPQRSTMVADEELEGLVQQYLFFADAEGQAEKEKQLLRQQIEAILGEADGAEGNGWKLSWHLNKGKPKTDWNAICAEGRVPRELVQQHTTRSPYRVFKVTNSAKPGAFEEEAA